LNFLDFILLFYYLLPQNSLFFWLRIT